MKLSDLRRFVTLERDWEEWRLKLLSGQTQDEEYPFAFKLYCLRLEYFYTKIALDS